MASPFLGQISMFGGNFAPRGWAFCQGQLLQISSNSALFSLLGTIYGGDGRATFALPDLRGRAAIGFGTGPGLPSFPQGSMGGEVQHTLTSNELPSHTHGISASNGAQTTNRPSGAYQAAGNRYSTSTDSSMAATQAAGGSQAHNNMQPYIALNYIIALQGIFPSRN